MNLLFNFGVAGALVILSGCASPTEPCSKCAPSTASTVTEASAFISEWVPMDQRQPGLGEMEFTAQDGRTLRFSELQGAPIALSFIYTRCQNARKCPLVARTMAQLQSELDRANLQPHPTLALITYDPEYDTPSRLDAFGRQFGFHPVSNALLLRPDPEMKSALFERFNIAVNFNTNGVNLHGIQLLLLDKNGRVSRTYRGPIWSNGQVVADLKTLAGESTPTPLVRK